MCVRIMRCVANVRKFATAYGFTPTARGLTQLQPTYTYTATATVHRTVSVTSDRENTVYGVRGLTESVTV